MQLTKLQVIALQWQIIYDLVFYAKGSKSMTFEQIQDKMDYAENQCRIWADVDDADCY